MKSIPFNRATVVGNELKYLENAIRSSHISGDGYYGKLCEDWFERNFQIQKALLTPSCTHALEMAALLCEIGVGDEVIMPSYTFVSTANAFALRGAKIVFVDINPGNMNIDERLIEQAITVNTKAIIPVHYAGVSCNMDAVIDIANKNNLFVVEDAAQALGSTYKGKPLGTFGHLGAFSFHETKNITSGGEGGLLMINDEQMTRRAEIIREKGTNRSSFFRGQVDKYTWVDVGSSYLPSELQAAYLYGQLEECDRIKSNRLASWNIYYYGLKELADRGLIELPDIESSKESNGHLFYIKVKNIEERTSLIEFLKLSGINAVFHYVPLHSSPAGMRFGTFNGKDVFTTSESERLARLPMYYNLQSEDINRIVDSIYQHYGIDR